MNNRIRCYNYFMLEDLVEQLAKVSYFQSLSNDDVASIIKAGKICRIPAQTCLFSEGEPCEGVFVLVKGEIHLEKISPSGQSSIMAVFSPVRMFNEAAALDGGLNPVSAIAVQDSIVWCITPAAFLDILLRYPTITIGLLKIMAARNRDLVAHYEDLSFRPVMSRAAKLLIDLSQNGTQPIQRRNHPNHVLAARISTVPEAFSRVLKLFRDSGAINSDRQVIVIVQPEILQEKANYVATIIE